MPFFSVIIPVYNKANFVEKTIQSVLNQTFQDFEIVIINDGSTDESENIILKIKDPRLKYFTTNNNGVARARNFGIENSNSSFVCFLDADDIWHDEFLESFYQYITSNSNQKVFSCAIDIETKNKIFHANYAIPKNNSAFEILDFFDSSNKEPILWTSSSVFSKSVFNEIGVFDSTIKIAEDTDLWIRIGLKYKILFIKKILARYVFDQNSISRTKTYIFEEKIFNKYLLEEKTNLRLKKFLDLNRFSNAIKYKITGNQTLFEEKYNQIDKKNIGCKKFILMNLPKPLLETLIKLKLLLANIGLGNSIFR